MRVKKLLLDFRITLWLIALIISLLLLFPKNYVVVKSVSETSPFYGKVYPGDRITWINENPVKDVSDVYRFSNYSGSIRMIVNDNLVLGDVKGNLGIEVEKKTSLKFGLDIGGGVRVLLASKDNTSSEILQATKEILENRINIFGLKEARLTIVDVENEKYIQIELAGGTLSEVKEILEKQGHLEGKISKIIKLKNGFGTLRIGNKNFEVMKNNSEIIIDGKKYNVNETFKLEDIEFQVWNYTENKIILFATAFSSSFEKKDIKKVCMVNEPGVCQVYILYNPKSKVYEFGFSVSITLEAAQRVKKLIENEEIYYSGNEAYLRNAKLYLFLDGKPLRVLEISAGLKNSIVTNVMIQGSGKTKSEAKKDMNVLQTILSSGALPVELEMVSVEVIPPILGERFLNEILWIGLIGEIIVILIIFFRYRIPKIAIPMIITSASEAIMILGLASLINWTIDLPSLAGIIAILGTGIDAQIMIIDEVLRGRKRVYSITEKIKHAFFIIFSSAATTFVAMLPLLSAGAKIMQGFAVTTIIGLFISVFVTRPAFGRLIEEIIK